MVFVARDNDIGKKDKKVKGNDQWGGYSAADQAQADMEKGIIPPSKKKSK